MSLERAIELFNNEEFYACHDVLEELWRQEPGNIREAYQGLLQIAVALHHYKNSNITGAVGLLQKAIRRLRPFSNTDLGFDVCQLLQICHIILKSLEIGEQITHLPKIGSGKPSD